MWAGHVFYCKLCKLTNINTPKFYLFLTTLAGNLSYHSTPDILCNTKRFLNTQFGHLYFISVLVGHRDGSSKSDRNAWKNIDI